MKMAGERKTVMATLGLPDLPKFGKDQERWLAERAAQKTAEPMKNGSAAKEDAADGAAAPSSKSMKSGVETETKRLSKEEAAATKLQSVKRGKTDRTLFKAKRAQTQVNEASPTNDVPKADTNSKLGGTPDGGATTSSSGVAAEGSGAAERRTFMSRLGHVVELRPLHL